MDAWMNTCKMILKWSNSIQLHWKYAMVGNVRIEHIIIEKLPYNTSLICNSCVKIKCKTKQRFSENKLHWKASKKRINTCKNIVNETPRPSTRQYNAVLQLVYREVFIFLNIPWISWHLLYSFWFKDHKTIFKLSFFYHV